MIFVCFIIVSFLLMCISLAEDSERFATFFMGVCLTSLFSCVFFIRQENTIEAIEVYQGKTTLEYTIRDGEIIDSIVVYKPVK